MIICSKATLEQVVVQKWCQKHFFQPKVPCKGHCPHKNQNSASQAFQIISLILLQNQSINQSINQNQSIQILPCCLYLCWNTWNKVPWVPKCPSVLSALSGLSVRVLFECPKFSNSLSWNFISRFILDIWL